MKANKFAIPVERLRWHCDPAIFDFECTKELAPLREFIGQERAIRAIQFSLSMDHDGYNVFVAGLTGTGKTSLVKAYVERLVEKKSVGDGYHPDDWAYVHNFSDLDRPRAINMPQGTCKEFRDKLANLQERLKEDLAKAFSSEDYKVRRKKMVEESQERERAIIEQIGEDARRQGFYLEVTQLGPALIPMLEGRPMTKEEFMALEEQVRKDLEDRRAALLKELQATMEKLQDLQRETIDKVVSMDRMLADITVSVLFEALLHDYEKQPLVLDYLRELKQYTMEDLDIFKEEEPNAPTLFGLPATQIMRGRDPFLPFRVNVFIDNSEIKGPPVITEPNPNYPNMFGKIERRFLMGGYVSDHTMLKAGAMQRANGGYLLLSAVEVLTNTAVWPALKRAIRTREVRIEDPFEQFGLMVPQGLRPEPVPINVKIFLIGDPTLYRLLAMYDEEFWELFRVKADFDHEVQKTEQNLRAFAAFIAGCCEDCAIHHFDRTGVAKVMEYASRMVSDQQKLSSRFSRIRELVQEAEYWSRQDGVDLVADRHVEQAIAERRFRHNLPDERIGEMMKRNMIMIDTAGAVVGQVNGLSVYSLGDFSFGKPSRITCRTYLGRQGIINIEREAQMSGPIHDKGVMILNGYLASRFAQDVPLSLSASLCFEQSYEGVEGDSASSTELYALLSSLSGIPLRQNIAVTGSVNQKGEIQPIGGINQKIEGFFQLCAARGLTGEQGVLMPVQNVDNLMLRQEVVDAVRDGKFHIYAVSTIDEGIEILTGAPMGERQEGGFPEGSISFLVDKTLREMADKLKRYAEPAGENSGSPKGPATK